MRRALLGLLANDRLHGCDLVGDIAYGVNHGGVVAFNGGIQISRFAAQVGTQPTCIKNRQPQRRANAPLLAARVQQLTQANA